jgi:hypothetical protein
MRKRKYIAAVAALLTAATIATGWATQINASPVTAGSKGTSSTFGRESSLAGSAGTSSKVVRESS